MALVCFLCLGAIRLTSFSQPRPYDIHNLVSDEQRLATIRGLIVTEPYINQNQQWQFANFLYRDPTSSFYLKVTEVKTLNGWAKTTGTVRVQVDEPILDLQAGDYVQAYCWLDRFKKPINPGQFNVAEYLARRNVFVAASIKSRSAIEVLRPERKNILANIKRTLRQKATLSLLGSPLPENETYGLLQALLLGYRADIGNRTYEAFRKTGLLHFISLSGLHLGIFIAAIWWLCKTAGLMKPVRAIICMIAIGGFLLVVPPRAPTLRAAIIGWVFCASFLFRRQPNSLNTLSLAAIILLLIRPMELFEAGWQLSFASVLGIILFGDRIHGRIYEKITNASRFKETPKSKLFYRIIAKPGAYMLRLFSVGFAAWLAGAGILLYHFYSINPFTSIWTVIAFPLVALILTIGYLKIFLSFVLPTLALGLDGIVTKVADLLIWIVEHIADLDISQILIGHVSLAIVILYYGFIIFAAFVHFRRPLLKKAICTGIALLIIVFLGATKWQRTHRDKLVITCLDVGHGQAILAQLPGKANILFDAGSLHRSDIGRRVVSPFLDYSGIDRINAIIISHNDVDHINGIPEIVEHCRVGSVYANDAFLVDAKADPCGTAGLLGELLHEKGLKIKNVEAINIRSAANIEMLWPTEQVCRDENLDDNDKSVVSLIEFAGRKILLCSDIERFAQKELLRLNPNLKADTVVAPHHGLVKTLDPHFLEKLGADIVICSCDRSDYKNSRIIKPPNKTRRFCTAEHGAVVVCINKDGMIR
jgi:competence protein ComEC